MLNGSAPQGELLPQVANPQIRKILIVMLKKGWLQPALARLPMGVVSKLKDFLVR